MKKRLQGFSESIYALRGLVEVNQSSPGALQHINWAGSIGCQNAASGLHGFDNDEAQWLKHAREQQQRLLEEPKPKDSSSLKIMHG